MNNEMTGWISDFAEVAKLCPRTSILNFVRGMSKESGCDWVLTAINSGWMGGKKFQIKATKADKDYLAKNKDKFSTGGKDLTKTLLKSIIPPIIKNAKIAQVALIRVSATVGALELSDGDRSELINAKAFRLIMDRYPKATIHLSENPGSPILFKHDWTGEAIAVVMPM
jgi:hypothetical protein